MSTRVSDGVVRRLRSAVRHRFNRSSTFRRAMVLASPREGRASLLRLAHLAWYEEREAIGPVQREEAVLLHSLVRVLCPTVIVEIGFSRGRSALNFLTALPADGRLFTFDIDPESEALAAKDFDYDPRLRFARRSQEEITAADVDHLPVDLLFLDGSHDFELNCRTFDALEPLLSQSGLFVVHDTGLWGRDVLGPLHAHYGRDYPEQWLSDDAYQHRPEERNFINWVGEAHPEFGRLQLESTRCLRHGMTIFQRQGPLPTARGDAEPSATAADLGAALS